MAIKNIFLDRDGTIIAERHYLCDPKEVELLPGTGQTLRFWQENGVRLFLVTNQSGIGRGYFKEHDYLAVHARLCKLLAIFGVSFTDSCFCPHAPNENCLCRKPGTGMWDILRTRHRLNPGETLMIGDKEADIVFAQNCNFALSALVLTGHGKKQATKLGVTPKPGSFSPKSGWPDIITTNLAELKNIIRERK